MKNTYRIHLLLITGMISLGEWAPAAPSLPITKPPVSPEISYSGPTNDSHAWMGQWFQSVTNSSLQVYRTHEFYDNTTNAGGGSKGHLAIAGYVTNIVFIKDFDENNCIASFDVVATVYNDTDTLPISSWVSGTNSLAESLTTNAGYSNTLSSVILTVDFATPSGITLTGNIDNHPYHNSSPYITAINHDYTSWYGWNSDTNQDGGYYVPGWDFGTILPGQSTNRILQFVIRDSYGSDIYMPYNDLRSTSLVESSTNGTDILINRSVSLKISQWLSDPAADNGSNYPVNLEEHDASNVSVFHNTVEDDTQSIVITHLGLETNAATLLLESQGSSGIRRPQVLQVTTNLLHTNWISQVTNETWPIPRVNHWTNVTFSGPMNYYRIVQP